MNKLVMPSIKTRVVVHFRDGKIVKGYTYDFTPNRDTFHVSPLRDETQTVHVSTFLVKAVFFVKSFKGNRGHETHEEFSMQNFKFDGVSLKIRVDFLDGEVMYGMTRGYAPNRKGFFIFPADKDTNNETVFVIREATAAVKTWR
jgi:hypothetical protein